jgi:hypothetical protein
MKLFNANVWTLFVCSMWNKKCFWFLIQTQIKVANWGLTWWPGLKLSWWPNQTKMHLYKKEIKFINCFAWNKQNLFFLFLIYVLYISVAHTQINISMKLSIYISNESVNQGFGAVKLQIHSLLHCFYLLSP